MVAPNDPNEWLRKLTESHRQVRLGRGVVGKTGHAMLLLLGIWAIIAWRWSENVWADVGLALGGLVATGVFIWWMQSTQRFAERNPAQALLEGAEFLEYQRFEAQAKGQPNLGRPSSPSISGPVISSDSAEERGNV